MKISYTISVIVILVFSQISFALADDYKKRVSVSTLMNGTNQILVLPLINVGDVGMYDRKEVYNIIEKHLNNEMLEYDLKIPVKHVQKGSLHDLEPQIDKDTLIILVRLNYYNLIGAGNDYSGKKMANISVNFYKMSQSVGDVYSNCSIPFLVKEENQPSYPEVDRAIGLCVPKLFFGDVLAVGSGADFPSIVHTN